MTTLHVATVPPQLDLVVLERILGSLETTLVGLGATRVWVDVDGHSLAVMAELHDSTGSPGRPVGTMRTDSC